MRYGHMFRKYEAAASLDASLYPRKFVLSKHLTTIALDLRNFLRSIRGPRLVLALIAAPFIGALLTLLIHGGLHRPHGQPITAVPGWEKYGYDQIRAGDSKKSSLRAAIRLKSYLNMFQKRRSFKVDSRNSITLIAACQNRKKSLAFTLPSWDAVKEIDEIVLVDWGSDSHQWEDLPLLDALIREGRLSFIRVPDAGDWVLSRAYNLAAKFATSKYILRVDCDTHLDPNFIRSHPKPGPKEYYTVGWGTERNENEQKLRGVWLTLKANYFKIGGYDERITEYGYEDTDLYERFQKLAKLEPKNIKLDTLKHSIVDHLLWEKENSNKISARVNEAIIKSAKPWLKEYKANRKMEYTLSYSQMHLDVHAKAVKMPSDPLDGRTEEKQEALKVDALQKALHDEYDIPWDILPSLALSDLEHLAVYLDSGMEKRVLVVCLDGLDTTSNVFNLVSALQLGLSSGRPVIAIWAGPHGSDLDQSKGPIIRQLFDLPATNELLSQAANSPVAAKYSLAGPTRLIAAKEWPCVETLAICAEKYDRAFDSFSEVVAIRRHVYDEAEPVPLSIRKHGFVRLSNITKIGNDETRALAFKSLVQAHVVRDKQAVFAEEPDVGIIATAGTTASKLAAEVRKKYEKTLASGKSGLIPVVGTSYHAVRRELMKGAKDGQGFCERKSCTVQEMAKELANVLAICNAKETFPPSKVATSDEWVTGADVTTMMVADLRILKRDYQ